MRIRTNSKAVQATLAGLCILFTASAASAQLAAVGATDPANGFPHWYLDAEGTALKLCLDPANMCGVILPRVDDPVSFPDNFPVEAPFWSAGTEILSGAVRARLDMSLVASFEAGGVLDGTQRVSSELRVRADGLTAGVTYQVTTPFGVFDLIADGDGEIRFILGSGGGVGDFTSVLTGVVSGFLVWDPALSAPPAGFVGNPLVPHTVIGSPDGKNFFRMQGLNVGGPGIDSIETDQFQVGGKIAFACDPNDPLTDTDLDGVPDCDDSCPLDAGKVIPGACGCGVPDTDTDLDGTPDCLDLCPADLNKIEPGLCGCGLPDVDSDLDGTLDCTDGCPTDPAKLEPGLCGCGVIENVIDTDGDGELDCLDGCPADAAKVAPGDCGCGNPDTDADGNGISDCLDTVDPNAGNGAGDGGAGAGDGGAGAGDGAGGDGSGDGSDGGDSSSSLLTLADCPVNLVLPATSAEGMVLDFVLPAVDGGQGVVDVVVDPPLGSVVPVGMSAVTITGTDEAGEEVSCSFVLTVLDLDSQQTTAPECGTGACGVGGAAMMPLMLLSCGWLKSRRRTKRDRRS